MDDLQRAYNALSAKNSAYDAYWKYYEGDQPLTYLNERLREVFRDLTPRFTENWCGVVVASCLERINLTGFTCKDQAAQAALDMLWAAQDWHQEAEDATEAALVCPESFLVIWPDASDTPQAYYNDPRLCHCFYEPENPRQMQFAAKWWDTDDGRRRLTLYYPDHLEYYVSRNKTDNIQSYTAFVPYTEEEGSGNGRAANPYGQIPVFHFRVSRRGNTSDLSPVIPIQNGINKLLSDMMVAAEFQALPQRYVISQADIAGKLKNAPNEIWNIPAGDSMGQPTSAGQFEAANLGNFLSTIAILVDHVAAITRTPKHYFFLQGGDPSGEALIAAEAPLNKKAEKRIERFTPTWQAAAAFALLIQGQKVDARDITPVWAPVQTVQPRTQAEIRQLNVAAGVPLITALRWEGKSQAEIDAMEQDREAEAGRNLPSYEGGGNGQVQTGQQAGQAVNTPAGLSQAEISDWALLAQEHSKAATALSQALGTGAP